MTKVTVPFTDEQVKSINEFQESGVFHPFTCGECGGILKATRHGMECYDCGKWHQTWVHSFMADESWKLARDLKRIESEDTFVPMEE